MLSAGGTFIVKESKAKIFLKTVMTSSRSLEMGLGPGEADESEDFGFLSGPSLYPEDVGSDEAAADRLQRVLDPYTPMFRTPILIRREGWHPVRGTSEWQAIGHAPLRISGILTPYRFLITDEEYRWVYEGAGSAEPESLSMENRAQAAVITLPDGVRVTGGTDPDLLRENLEDDDEIDYVSPPDPSANGTSLWTSLFLLATAAVGGVALGNSHRRRGL